MEIRSEKKQRLPLISKRQRYDHLSWENVSETHAPTISSKKQKRLMMVRVLGPVKLAENVIMRWKTIAMIAGGSCPKKKKKKKKKKEKKNGLQRGKGRVKHIPFYCKRICGMRKPEKKV